VDEVCHQREGGVQEGEAAPFSTHKGSPFISRPGKEGEGERREENREQDAGTGLETFFVCSQRKKSISRGGKKKNGAVLGFSWRRRGLRFW